MKDPFDPSGLGGLGGTHRDGNTASESGCQCDDNYQERKFCDTGTQRASYYFRTCEATSYSPRAQQKYLIPAT